MGRTKRLRIVKKSKTIVKHLNHEQSTIDFFKWMTSDGWVDLTKFRIAEFPDTGRGVLSLKPVKENDVLIEIPLNLMITYKTLEENALFKSVIKNCCTLLSIHELLGIFVVIEQHIGAKSEWYNYIKYLPDLNEIHLPWFCSNDEVKLIPEDLKMSVEECRNNIEESWLHVSTILKSYLYCQHCSANFSNILTHSSYKWAYTVVNTRAVYIDPVEIKKMAGVSLEKIISDQPTMALCPFLDMFNHHSKVSVKAILKPNENVPKYCLITENKFNKYEEIFISYGAHDNKKLLTQYGFIIPDNKFDCVEFHLKEVITVCKINTTSRQYKFLCEHNFNNDIYVNSSKFSFNMNAVLFVLSHKNDLDWSMRVYTAVYTKEQLKLMYGLAEILLKWKLREYEKELENINLKINSYSSNFIICVNYLKNRIEFIRNIIEV